MSSFRSISTHNTKDTWIHMRRKDNRGATEDRGARADETTDMSRDRLQEEHGSTGAARQQPAANQATIVGKQHDLKAKAE